MTASTTATTATTAMCASLSRNDSLAMDNHTPAKQQEPSQADDSFRAKAMRLLLFLVQTCSMCFLLSQAIIGFGSCQAIPGLTSFIVAFCATNWTSTFLKYWYQIPSDPKKKKEGHLPTNIESFVGICMIAVVVWGDVLVFPNLHLFPSGSAGVECEGKTFMMSAIPCFIVTGIVGSIWTSMLAAKAYKLMYGSSEEEKQQDTNAEAAAQEKPAGEPVPPALPAALP